VYPSRRETVDTLALDDAVLHEAHGARGQVVAQIPVGRAGDRVGLAALAGAQPGVVRCRRGAKEADVAGLGSEGGTARPAVDARGRDPGDELPVEAGVARGERAVLGLEGQLHPFSLAPAPDIDWRKSDMAAPGLASEHVARRIAGRTG
jgi:hypothetical protein